MGKTSTIGLLLVAAAVSAGAQPADPPSRVARLNLLLGPVSFRPGSVEDWAPATINYPLTTGDHLWTEAGSKAELHVGATAIRLDGQTALGVLNLDDRMVQLSVTGGTVNIHIRSLMPEESFEVDTPNVALSLLRPGDYRISADGDQNLTFAVVRGGEAEVTGGGAAFPIRPGESARIVGSDGVSPEMGPAPPLDAFDQWALSREQREASTISARYVPRDMIGYEDLDQYGVWRDVPPYGWVWAPAGVAVGWAPYRFGHWAWVSPWGWTWIDDAPWGFAPFHYGRWAAVGATWVWVPGRVVAGMRPVYAPALVAFVGGPRFGVAVGMGAGVGVAAWFPLGPGEVYRPGYAVSEVYVRNVNIVHVSNVTVINNVNVTNVRYMNQNVAGAVTVVPHESFAAGRPVAVAAIAVRPGAMAEARVVETAGVAPTREAVFGHAGPMVAHAPPSRFVERQVVARNAPPPPPVSFAAQQQALRGNAGRPLAPEAVNNLRGSAPATHPMVRTVGGGGSLPGGAPPGAGPGPGPRPAAQPTEFNRPPRNDRPPSVQRPPNQPTYNPPGQYSPPVVPQRPPANTPAQPAPAVQQRPPVNSAPPPAPAVQQHPPVNNPPPARNPETERTATPPPTQTPQGQQHVNERPPAKGQPPNKNNKKTEKQ